MSHPDERPTGEHDAAALDERLTAFYRAVSYAQAFGHFSGHHGPFEETAWLHVAIHQLDEADRLASAVLDKDVRGLSRFRAILDAASDPGAVAMAAAKEKRIEVLEGREPALLAAVAVVLDRLTDSSGTYFHRAQSYYSSRATRIQAALDRAGDVVAGRSPIQNFSAEIARLNPLSSTAHGGHGMVAMAHAGVKDAGHHEHRAAENIHAAFGAIAESASDSPIEAMCDCPALSAASQARLAALSTFVHENETDWRRFLSIRNQPFQVPLVMPPRRYLCVPGRPQFGGQWEVAALRVTETDERCPPGEALYDLGSKAYGKAGAELIKAQNEWIKAKECYGDANKTRGDCIKKEDQSYERCDVEEDQGYERCDREEDRGYRDCCDWWPCSWACKAWTWIKNIVCVVATWIENWVCIVKTWIEKIVCVAWAYIIATVCAITHIAKAVVHAAKGIGGILAGAALKTVGNFVGRTCEVFGWKPASREATRFNVVGVHVAVLHTNKVLLLSYDEGNYPVSAANPADFTAIGDSDRALCALWDFRNSAGRYVKLTRNLFCAHTSFCADGRLFAAGGQFPLPGLLKNLFPPELLAPGADKDLHVFNPATETWTRLHDMAKGRWYPTSVSLPDGRVFISSGTNGWATEAGFGRGIQDSWEIADPNTGTVVGPFAFGFHLYHLYPFQHVLPSGQVFIHFKRTTILFDPATLGTVRVAAGGASTTQTGRTQHLYSRTGPGPGTCVLLPLLPSVNPAGEINYPAGRIMILGGGGAEKEPEPADPTDEEQRSDGSTGYNLHSTTKATNTAEILDFAASSPEWRLTQPMHNGRVMPDSVLLPNGRVLVIGGGRFGQSGGLLAHFTSTDTEGKPDKGATDPVMEPEMFDPETETWEMLCPRSLARLYHTSAVLLPDARVLVAGHDGALNMPPFDSSRYELEIFSPPYLFDAAGKLASRPVVAQAPEHVRLAQRFNIRIGAASAIKSVVLIRQSSTTHQINSDQRLVGLTIVNANDERVEVVMPAQGGVAPPGFYMLFVVDSDGVPSVAHWMRISA